MVDLPEASSPVAFRTTGAQVWTRIRVLQFWTSELAALWVSPS